uniref:Acetyl-coenzyme A carboxylase carboxyl transferase subunit beta, chloroplastic n=1 Tax=Lathyrus littoralis TaxID=313097 RepID=A0A0F6NEV2_LATLI|nr:acetyl-CoA carboxylase carboxyltransferase beta subunit [Lathyrus littoralis]AIK20936.1 acetyl-CoA carboxylase carboxyltransferase beta subunit [Lathyrus littoralis]
MERKWFNSMLFKRNLEYRCGLSKPMDSFGPIENNGVNEDPSSLVNEDPSSLTDIDNSIHRWKNNSENCSYNHGDYLADPYDKIFEVWDSHSNTYDIYAAYYYTYTNDDDWTNTMNRCIESYISQICEDSDKYNASDGDIDFTNTYINDTYICDKGTVIIIRITNPRTRNDVNDIDDTNDQNYIYDPLDPTNDIDINNIYNAFTAINDPSDTNDTNHIDGPFAISESDINDPSDTNDTNHIDDPFEISESNINDPSDTDNIYGTYDLFEISDINDPSDTNDTNHIDDPDHLYDTDRKDRKDIGERSSEIYRINRENDTNDPLYCMNKFSHLWVQCETCYGINFKPFFPSKMNICEHCGEHLKMSSSDRIELSIDPGTWNPMDEKMISLDPIEFDSIELDSEEESSKDRLDQENVSLDPIELEESSKDRLDQENVSLDPIELDSEEESSKDRLDQENVSLDPIELDSEEEEEQSYIDRLDSYQEKTGLPEAVQTGTGQLNGIPLAIAVMDSEFIAGSMGSVVGEKITRLIEYATNQLLPLIIICASGGARMQEGSLSLMQMAKISSALYNYQINQKLFYVAILTSPTTGGVTASFGMLGDIIIAEPNATIAFAGKRVIEQLLNQEVPEGSQSADLLFDKGLLDSVVPRPLLKDFLTQLFQFHGFVPLT